MTIFEPYHASLAPSLIATLLFCEHDGEQRLTGLSNFWSQLNSGSTVAHDADRLQDWEDRFAGPYPGDNAFAPPPPAPAPPIHPSTAGSAMPLPPLPPNPSPAVPAPTPATAALPNSSSASSSNNSTTPAVGPADAPPSVAGFKRKRDQVGGL